MLNMSDDVIISDCCKVPLTEIEISAVRSQGAGGQKVNKVATAAHLRLDIRKSSLPGHVKERLLAMNDHRISDSGVIIIKAQRYRTLESNRRAALERLRELLRSVSSEPKRRQPTKPPAAAKRERLDAKRRRGHVKRLRSRVDDD
jgi:ribosome-associated protein